ncbi:MAG: hypothetical protein ACI4MI_03760 [Christensenellales bacterium]
MKKSAIDLILDTEYDGSVTLYDEQGKAVEFEQIALIPYDKKMYAILVEKEIFDKGDLEEAGLVFELDEEEGSVKQVEDVNVISQVFEIYDRLFEEREY